jgi:hypothetical protein
LKQLGVRIEEGIDITPDTSVADICDRLGDTAINVVINNAIADNTSGSPYSYRMSKVALSMAGKSLAHDLKLRGIAVAILYPGLLCYNFHENALPLA